jgi:hypothetical protein
LLRSSPQLDRRKRAQSLGKGNTDARSSEEDMSSGFVDRRTRKETWQAERNVPRIPAPTSWSIDLGGVGDSPSINMLPRRATNSPPVPALLAKVFNNILENFYLHKVTF